MQPTPIRQYLSRKEAAAYLNVIAEATLAKLAVIGGGPRFYKLGRRVGYKIQDLDSWAKARTSTSDPGPEPGPQSTIQGKSPNPGRRSRTKTRTPTGCPEPEPEPEAAAS